LLQDLARRLTPGSAKVAPGRRGGALDEPRPNLQAAIETGNSATEQAESTLSATKTVKDRQEN
jgi:hypothetical protein